MKRLSNVKDGHGGSCSVDVQLNEGGGNGMSGFKSERTERLIEFLREEIQAAHDDFSKTSDIGSFHDVVTLLTVLKNAELNIYGSVKTKEFDGLWKN